MAGEGANLQKKRNSSQENYALLRKWFDCDTSSMIAGPNVSDDLENKKFPRWFRNLMLVCTLQRKNGLNMPHMFQVLPASFAADADIWSAGRVSASLFL